jgi:hypothetical protein
MERVIDVFNPWTMWVVEETLGQGLGKAVLSRMRRVEIDIFWHWLPMPASTLTGSEEVTKVLCPRENEVQMRVARMQRIVDVLRKAERLRFLTLTWKEVAPLRSEGDEENVTWEMEARRQVLQPLRQLRGLRVMDGDIIASDAVEKEIEKFLGGLDRDMQDGEEHSRFVGCVGPTTGLTVEDKRVLAELLMGEGQYLLTPEDREIHRKPSYFE